MASNNTTRAEGTFTIERWEEERYDEREGATLSRAHVTKTFRGDIEGTSTTDLLMAVTPVEGSAAYVGFERIIGHLHGREGTFVLHHSATAEGETNSLSWSVVPDSATGELRGLRGEGKIAVDSVGGHSYTLDYEIE